MVLRLGAALGRGRAHRRHVLHACRVELRDDVSAMHVEGDSMRAGHRRSAHQERDGAPDVAGLPEEQVRGLLRQGRQGSRARHDRRRRSGDGVPDLDLAGLHDGLAEVDVDGQQQDAGRRRVFLQQGRLQHRQPTGDYRAAGYGCVVCGCQPARPQSWHAL